MSNKISKKKLLGEVLPALGLDPQRVSFEAYGKTVYAFIRVPSFEVRRNFESLLAQAGCRIGACYSPGQPVIEVTNISYFKAWHWDE
jgi:hypothetical protein